MGSFTLSHDALLKVNLRKHLNGDFPGGLVAKTPCSQCRGSGSLPGRELRVPTLPLKFSQAATETQCSQIHYIKKKKASRCPETGKWQNKMHFNHTMYKAWYYRGKKLIYKDAMWKHKTTFMKKEKAWKKDTKTKSKMFSHLSLNRRAMREMFPSIIGWTGLHLSGTEVSYQNSSSRGLFTCKTGVTP